MYVLSAHYYHEKMAKKEVSKICEVLVGSGAASPTLQADLAFQGSRTKYAFQLQ